MMRLMMMMSVMILLCLGAAHASAQSQPTTKRATAPYSDNYFISTERSSYHNEHPMRGKPGTQCVVSRWQHNTPHHTLVMIDIYDAEGRLTASSSRVDGPQPARPDIMTSDAVSYRWRADVLDGIDVVSRRQGADEIVAKKVSNYTRDKRGHVIKLTTDYTDYTGPKPKTTKYVTQYKRDAQGRIIQSTDNTRGRKNVEIYRYSEGGRLLERREIDDGTYLGVRRYDAADRTLETLSPKTSIPPLRWMYDAAGRITSKTTPENVVIQRWFYDQAGRITRMDWRYDQDTAEQPFAQVDLVYHEGDHQVEASCSMGGAERVRFKMTGLGCTLAPFTVEDLGMRCGMSRFTR